MILFPIEFCYSEITYRANAHKIPGSPVQFHVSGYEPLNDSFINPYIFMWSEKERELQYSINPDMMTLGGKIAAAIFKGCSERGISYDK